MSKPRNGNRKCRCGHYYANHSMKDGDHKCYATDCACKAPEPKGAKR